jgi:hypothetical protein
MQQLSSFRAEAAVPLPDDTNAFMSERLGRDFSHVRIHTGKQANLLAKALRAQALTVGHDIAFEDGRYAPYTAQGRKLIAHELSHVLKNETHPGSARVARKVSLGNQELYRFYVSTRDYAGIAVILNGESPQVIREELNHFSGFEQAMIHEKAKEWPGIDSNIARMTASHSIDPVEQKAPKPYQPSAKKTKLRELYPEGAEAKAIDAVIKELGIDTNLLERGTMEYQGGVAAKGVDAITFRPHDSKLEWDNDKPHVRLFGPAFSQEWARLRSTVWHEYQHVLQYATTGMLVSGIGTSDSAAEVEAYCKEAIESEWTGMDATSLEELSRRLETKWRRLTRNWSRVTKSQRLRLTELHDRALAAIKRMS